MTDPSFYYAIFKRLQAATGSMSVYDDGDHFADDDTLYLAGGFSLRSTDNKYGIFAQLSYNAVNYPDYPALQQYWWPLAPASTVPAENPLWALLNASLMPGPGGVLPLSVTVNTPDGAQDWPIMPKPDQLTHTIEKYADWKEFNASPPPHRLIDVFGTWISNGKHDDTPRTPPLTYMSLKQTVLKPFGFMKGSEAFPILFIASMAGDDGRRPGDKGTPPADPNHVPTHFWATSQIFLTYPAGVTGHTPGTIATPAHLQPGEEYYVSAVIGNAGNVPAGRVVGPDKILVICEAQAFNSGFGPATPPLPALTNLDATDTWPLYEQYGLGTGRYDIIGFRFNVDSVIAALKPQLTGAELGGSTAEEWLNDSHPCVKVLIRGGEPAGPYSLDPNNPPTFDSNPRTERHVAQRNLAPFLIPPLMGLKKIGWKNFIVGQMGSGANQLELQHTLPAETFHFYLAIPTRSYERYVAKGGMRGFEVVAKVANKPFPDAVILRQTSAGARLGIAEHAKERFFGMSLGIECDPARLKGLRLTDVAMVQTLHDGTIGGGFTLKLQVTR